MTPSEYLKSLLGEINWSSGKYLKSLLEENNVDNVVFFESWTISKDCDTDAYLSHHMYQMTVEIGGWQTKPIGCFIV